MGDYVYEYVRASGQRTDLMTVVHFDNGRVCNYGRGNPRNAGARHGLYRWQGPFETLEAAREAARRISGRDLPCRHCRPFVVTTVVTT
jgi:hypothetical protein